MSHAIAFHVPRPAWLGLLRTRTEGASWSVCLGKGEPPPRGATELHLFAGGRLRGILQIDRVWNSCFGFWIDSDPTRLRASTLGPKTPPERQPSVSWWLGWRDVAWKDGDLVPFPDWATEGLPEEVRAEAAALARRPLRPPPEEPFPHFAPLDPYTVVPMVEPSPEPSAAAGATTPSATRVPRQAAQPEPAKPAAPRQAPAAAKAPEPRPAAQRATERPDDTTAKLPKASKRTSAHEPEQLGLLLKGF